MVFFKNISILPFCNEIYYMYVDWVLMWSLAVSFVDIKNEIRIKFVNRVTICFVTTLLYIKLLKRFESSHWRHPLKNFWIRPCWLFNLHSFLQQSAFMRVLTNIHFYSRVLLWGCHDTLEVKWSCLKISKWLYHNKHVFAFSIYL